VCRFVNSDNLARLSKCAELGVGRSGKPLSHLFFATSEEFQYGLSCGSFNSVDLVSVSELSTLLMQAYLARIAKVNPILNAIIETNPEAIEMAASLDCVGGSRTRLGPLHRIPIIVKDNIAIAMSNSSSMNTIAESYTFLRSVPPVILQSPPNWGRQAQSSSAKGTFFSGPIIDLQTGSISFCKLI